MRLLIFFSFLAILFAGACKPTTSTPSPSTSTSGPLKGIIDSTTAKRFVHNFNGREYKRKNFLGWHGSRTVWFSKEQLKALIDKVYEENGDGIRFYFAAYDSTQKPGYKANPRYLDQSTLIMVSTFDTIAVRDGKKDTLHWDYYFDRKKGREGRILTTIPENQGELCPPPANCFSEGALLLE